MPNDTAAKLQSAKEALAKARGFTKSAEGHSTSIFAPKPKAPETKAPYSLVGDIRKKMADEQADSRQTGQGIKSNVQNVENYEKVYGKP